MACLLLAKGLGLGAQRFGNLSYYRVGGYYRCSLAFLSQCHDLYYMLLREICLRKVTPDETTEEGNLIQAFVSAETDVIWSAYVGPKLMIRI